MGEFVEGGGESSACEVSHGAEGDLGVDECGDQAVEWGAIAFDIGVELEFTASDQDGCAMIAEVSVDQDGVVGLKQVGGDLLVCGDHADASGADEDLVGGPAWDDLGITGDDLDIGIAGGLAHACEDGAQGVHRETFFEDQAARKIEWAGARDGEIIDCAVDSELSDVATREKQRADHVAIGGKGQAVAVACEVCERKARLVFLDLEVGVVEGLADHVIDQVVHGFSAATVGLRDHGIADTSRTTARAFDAIPQLGEG